MGACIGGYSDQVRGRAAIILTKSGEGCVRCESTKCSPTQYAPFSSILCTLHTQYAPLEHFVYPAYTICYQWSILCRVDTYVISVVVRGYTICSS